MQPCTQDPRYSLSLCFSIFIIQTLKTRGLILTARWERSFFLSKIVDMPKWKSSYDTGRKYNSKWEKDFNWVSEAPNTKDKAYCKLCRRVLQAKRDALATHEKSDIHRCFVSSSSSSRSLMLCFPTTNSTAERAIQENDIMIAVQTACHEFIRTVDHLGEIVAKYGEKVTWNISDYTVPSPRRSSPKS